jgi:DNA adenine methylase
LRPWQADEQARDFQRSDTPERHPDRAARAPAKVALQRLRDRGDVARVVPDLVRASHPRGSGEAVIYAPAPTLPPLLRVAPCHARRPRGALTPIVKWAGGKRKLAPTLAARMPNSYARYFEPFAGGAALYLHVEPEHAVLSDANADLMRLYLDVAHRLDSLIADLEWHARNHSETYYYEVRSRWNDGWNDGRHDTPGTSRSAALLYLNKTCFNGLWRVNDEGKFNTAIGRYSHPAILDERALRAVAPALARAELGVSDFRQVVAAARGGDFVYLDPPYIPTSITSRFAGYTPGGFGERDHRDLADAARALARRGVQVMLSNSDTPLAWELYGAWPGFRIERVSRTGTMSSNTSKRGRISELLITAGYQDTASH